VEHKAILRYEFSALKNSMNPVTFIKDTVGVEGIIGPLAGAGINAGIDMVVKNNLLAKSGFIVRSLVPLALKTFVNIFSRKEN
jgi:hypothetical protein